MKQNRTLSEGVSGSWLEALILLDILYKTV